MTRNLLRSPHPALAQDGRICKLACTLPSAVIPIVLLLCIYFLGNNVTAWPSIMTVQCCAGFIKNLHRYGSTTAILAWGVLEFKQVRSAALSVLQTKICNCLDSCIVHQACIGLPQAFSGHAGDMCRRVCIHLVEALVVAVVDVLADCRATKTRVCTMLLWSTCIGQLTFSRPATSVKM